MRTARIERNTFETKITVEVNLDGMGRCDIATGIGFFDHMLEQIGRHGLIDLTVKAEGDLHVGTGMIQLRMLVSPLEWPCVRQWVSDGDLFVMERAMFPLDEALSRVVIDLSGRPGLVFVANFTAPMIGQFDSQLVREFFQGVVNHAAMTVHVDNLRGENAHHQAETIFKAFGRALRQAVPSDERLGARFRVQRGVYEPDRSC